MVWVVSRLGLLKSFIKIHKQEVKRPSDSLVERVYLLFTVSSYAISLIYLVQSSLERVFIFHCYSNCVELQSVMYVVQSVKRGL